MTDISKYQIRKLYKKLTDGSAHLLGQTTDGWAWPYGNHHYIIQDNQGKIFHVPVDFRPTWEKKFIPIYLKD